MAEIPSGSVIITPDDMWKTIQETAESSRRTEAAVNELKVLVNPALGDLRRDLEKLDDREQEHYDRHAGSILELQQQSWSSRWVPAIITSLLVAVIAGVAMLVITKALSQ